MVNPRGGVRRQVSLIQEQQRVQDKDAGLLLSESTAEEQCAGCRAVEYLFVYAWAF